MISNIKKNLKIFFIVSICILINVFSVSAKNKPLDPIVEKAKKSMVKIESVASAYSGAPCINNKRYHIGTIIDKNKGIIISYNNSRSVDITINIRIFNGKELKAKLFYRDPWNGLEFLKVDPRLLPKDITETKFENSIKMNQKIFVLDNYENSGFSKHKGIITNLNIIDFFEMSSQKINLSMNTSVNNNLSPVFNSKGNAVGLKTSGGDTHALALHPKYIEYILNFLKQNKEPIRRHNGVITKMYSLGRAFKMRKFPKKLLMEHGRKYGKSRLEAIEVFSIIKNTPAENKLLNGDIIWEVNGKRVGPNLVEVDMLMNNSGNNPIIFTVYRSLLNSNKKIEWKKLNIKINTIDINKSNINAFVKFGNLLLFESDLYFSKILNVPLKTLLIREFFLGLPAYSYGFNLLLEYNLIVLEKINNIKIKNLNDFINKSSNIFKNKTFYIKGKFYNLGTLNSFDSILDIEREGYELQKYTFVSKDTNWKILTLNK